MLFDFLNNEKNQISIFLWQLSYWEYGKLGQRIKGFDKISTENLAVLEKI